MKKKIKRVLLVNPLVKLDSGTPNWFYPYPLALPYLKSYIEKYSKFKVRSIDCAKYDFPYYLKRFSPDVVGFSCMIAQYPTVKRLLEFTKKFNASIITLVGGYLPTYSYEILLKELESVLDFCVIGEGEISLLKLLYTLNSKKNVGCLRGIAYLKRGRIVYGGKGEEVEELDKLPFPCRRKIKKDASILISRGCTFKCSFCTINNYYIHPYRFRSVKSVIKELEFLKFKCVRRIKILDDNFIPSWSWFEEFYIKMKTHKLNQISYEAQLHPLKIKQNPKLLNLLYELNFKTLNIGIQSLDEKDLCRFNHPLTPKELNKVISILKKHPRGLNVNVYQIINSYCEDSVSELIRKNLAFVNAFKGSSIKIVPHILQLWPGTGLRDLLKAYSEQTLILERDFVLGYEPHGRNFILSTPNISRSQLYRVFLQYIKNLAKLKLLVGMEANLLIKSLYTINRVIYSSLRPFTKLRFLLDYLFYRLIHPKEWKRSLFEKYF